MCAVCSFNNNNNNTDTSLQVFKFCSTDACLVVVVVVVVVCAHALNTLTYDRSCFMRYILLVLFFLIKSTRLRLVLLIEKKYEQNISHKTRANIR